MSQYKFSAELIKILSKAVQEKIYGSVEIYFESGNVTQITQRIINKVTNPRTHNTPQNSAQERYGVVKTGTNVKKTNLNKETDIFISK